MALWGKTDAPESKPKYLPAGDVQDAVFVSAQEALLGTNKAKGITGAGWWLVKEYTASNGESRYKTELLVAMSVSNATSGDAADDAVVADVEIVITIGTQPDPNLYYYNNSQTISVAASVNEGNLTYQWQKKLPAAGSRWTNIPEETSSTYTTPVMVEEDNGTEFRVVISSDSGAKKVYSEVSKAIFD